MEMDDERDESLLELGPLVGGGRRLFKSKRPTWRGRGAK